MWAEEFTVNPDSVSVFYDDFNEKLTPVSGVENSKFPRIIFIRE